jgi:RNA polymerase sigma factor (sigma-70 family)
VPESTATEQIAQAEIATAIRKAINQLRPRDAQVIRMRYGIDGPPQTLEQIGIRFGLTRERIRQIQARAEERLRRMLADDWRLESENGSDLLRKG